MKDSDSLDIPPVLQRKLEEFRSRLWSVKIGEGALAGIAGLAFSFLLVFLIDRFADTPVWLRGSILLLGAAVPAVLIPLRYHRWVWEKRSLEQIARVLRRRYPKLGDELLGIVELARDEKGRSVLVTAAMRQVAERVSDHDFSDAVPENHYRKWFALTSAAVGFSVIASLVVANAAQSSLARWLTPWRLVERYTFAQLEPVAREIIVPYAERFDLSAQLRETTEWEPEVATVRLPGSTSLRSEKDEENRSYSFDLPPQKDDAALVLRVGDAREKVRVQPVIRPELTELKAVVRLPDYLLYRNDPVIPIRGASIDLVEGARVSFVGTTSRRLSRATMDGAAIETSGTSFRTAPEPIEASANRVFAWEDSLGLSAKAPRELRINAVEDTPPELFAKRVSAEEVVLVDEVVRFEIGARDDFGLREVGLEWVGARDPSRESEASTGSKMVASGGAEAREVLTQGTFSAARNGVAPQTLQIRAYAEDFFPDRGRVYSPVFVVRILDPSDHANWLTEEFGRWFRRAREVYEREQQLHEMNRQLQGLTPEEMDRPENRRRVERQAAAESSNARRLGALTGAGRELIRQAAKNEEFDADRLETWAQMMRALDEIAGEKMPSVAELLERSARAAGASAGERQPEAEEATDPGEGGSAPSVRNIAGEEAIREAAGEKEGGETPPSSASPSISDHESSFAEAGPEEAEGSEAAGSGQGRLGLPTTILRGGMEEGEQPRAESPAQEKLFQAVVEQKELLERFAEVTDELQQILSSLEASTFVKRLKAASRRQLEIAKQLNATLENGFGLSRERTSALLQDLAVETARAEREESERVRTIKNDLDAYYQRKQEPVYRNVLDQMRSTEVVTELQRLGDEAAINLNGRSLSAAEFWSDTLDRWAEELVSASQGEQQGEGEAEDRPGLPPEIVLEVMRIARGEMDLREETRELQGIRPALSPGEFAERAKPLEIEQGDLRQRVDEVVLDVLDLPEAEQNHGNEIRLLNFVSDVMRQARGILARPETGPEVIAAQTEVIELLLQARRQNPNSGGGGGGGGSPGMGASSGTGSALSDIGVGPGGTSEPGGGTRRSVDQTTGKTGRKLPEEFRTGLDTYFNQLEKIR